MHHRDWRMGSVVITLIKFSLDPEGRKQLTGWEEANAHMALKLDPSFLEFGLQLVSGGFSRPPHF